MDEEVDWYNASEGIPWTTKGGDYVSEKLHEITVIRPVYGWVSFNVLKTVKDFIVNPDKNFGFLLKNSALSMEIDVGSSKFDFDTLMRPKMVIVYSASAVAFTSQRVGDSPGQPPVSLTTVNRTLHIANNSVTPVHITLYRLDGTAVAAEMLAGGVRKNLSVRSAGVYLLSISDNNYTVNEKVSLFH